MVTPLQLYFNYKMAFKNYQVRTRRQHDFPKLIRCNVAVAAVHDVLLLWKHIHRLCLPHVLLVRHSPPLFSVLER